MKKMMLMLMTVVLFSLSAWSQSSVIIPLGNAVITKNSFVSAKQLFKEKDMTLDIQSSNRGFFMEGRGDFAIMAVVEGTASGTIKEVSFLCGAMYWGGLEEEIQKAGYKLIHKGKTTLGNGASVPQKTYSNGIKRCYVRTLDNAMVQIVFKRKATQTSNKTARKR